MMELVRIIHRVGQYMEFILLNEFFRMAGVYVQEYQIIVDGKKSDIEYDLLADNGIDALELREYDVTLWVMEKNGMSRQKELRYAESNNFVLVDAFAGKYNWTKKDNTAYLKKVLADISQNNTNLKNAVSELQRLRDIFCKKDLMFYAYNMRYLLKSEMRNCYQGFQDAYKAVADMRKPESFGYITCFKVNCARKVNEACSRLNWIREYSSDRLIKEILSLSNINDAWHRPHALAGYIAEQDPDLQKYAFSYYQQALTLEKGYDSHLYYHIGRFYEKTMKDMPASMRYYRRSYKIDPSNFRAAYKIAYIGEYKKEYGETWYLYNKIVDRMLKIKEKGYLQPIEIEYLFKVYSRLIRIARVNLGRVITAKKIAEEAVKEYESLENNNFFAEFYRGNCGKRMRGAMEEEVYRRLPLSQIVNERKELEGSLLRFKIRV